MPEGHEHREPPPGIRTLPAAGDPQAAEQLVRQAIEREPERSDHWNQLGRVLQSTGRLGEALQAYGTAAETDRADVISRVRIGHLFRQMSFPDDAIPWYAEALALRPDDLILQLNHALVLPVVAESDEQLERLCRRSLEQLDRLERSRPAARLGSHPFHPHLYNLIYRDDDHRKAMESYGRLFRNVIPQPAASNGGRPSSGTAAALDRAAASGSRPRIGFLSGFFRHHTNSSAFEGWIRHLDRSRFQLVLIHLHDSRHDPVQARLDAAAEEVITLPANLGEAQRQLLHLQLDLLFFTDIGMHPMVTLLSCRRYAPVQVTGWGVPQTSGLASIDAYISGSLVEPDAAQQHYSETLVTVPGLPCCYLSDQFRDQPGEGDVVPLPRDVPLIGCPQSLWKLPPGFDAWLEQIAQRVPEARFVFIQADISSYSQIFMERLQRSAPCVSARAILLPRMERGSFLALVEQIDLLLDPPNFSSGIMAFDALYTGTPIVAMEGAFLRSRFVAGIYRQIGLENAPVARDRDHYVALAVQLLQQPDALQQMTTLIRHLARRHLYDRVEGLRAFEDFALDAIGRAAS